VLAVCFILGNSSPEYRSHVANMQLVALCREKQYDHFQFYKPLMQDLKSLETDGIEIYRGKTVKGTATFISGDNLGSHSIGGLVENFSFAEFFCRYCLIDRPFSE